MSRGYSSPPPPRRLKLQRQRLCRVARFSSDHETAPITQQRNRHVRVTTKADICSAQEYVRFGPKVTPAVQYAMSALGRKRISSLCLLLRRYDRPTGADN